MSTFSKRLLLGAMLIAVSLSAHAAFYKWVDANGVTQYSQSPPPSGHYQEMRSPSPPPAGDTNAEQQKVEASPPTQGSASARAAAAPPDAKRQAKQAMEQERYCQRARQNLATLENHARLRYKSEDGSLRIMSDEEKQARITETRKMIDETCQ